ncbi:secreted Zn-dependent insulinase-like peptidase [Sinobacterium caligoides]|uniref:Protease 3 n=1 Tax=Sinobacterium caligoides TaxID=933926 RepID=A0A3N2E0M0_9GAMM|nr:insulinase family protein [Sinobacterium caligoides]ROS05452.1 secreted Zn-dependent insulinase-like peptidase [Sinobacterium caligoides]
MAVKRLNTAVTTWVTLILTTFLLVACGSNGLGGGSVEVVKSPNDSRDYRYLQLDNGLKVLLISDPTTDKSAAALDVEVGSAQDPKDREGLAHFLEHMLFLGTDKYPKPEAYQAYISAHGGSHNAFTAFENTNYFFDVEPDYLPGALDRFSRFFVAPLFTEAYVEREKNAVYSEYKAKLKNEFRRGYDVFKQELNPEHPMAKFSVGDLKTLADRKTADGGEDKVRDDLLKFYAQHYSANVMTLAVLGRENLDQLEQMVRQRFAEVPSRKVPSNKIEQPLFAKGKLPGLLQIEPLRDVRSLSFAFAMPSQRDHYHSKPELFIGDVLGHEGEGSLLQYLKQQGLAEGLSAGSGMDYNGGALFNINVSLTAKGEQQWPLVAKAVYQTINGMRAEEVTKAAFEEQQRLMDIRFRFQEKRGAMSTVSSLAGLMQLYAPSDILAGSYLLDEFKPRRTAELLDYLRPEKALLTLTSKSAKTDKVTVLYDTPYSYQKIDAATLQSWQQAGTNQAITLPAKNQFIAEDFTLLNAKAAAQPPRLIGDDPRYQLWFGVDQEFRIPKGVLRATMKSESVQQSPAAVVKLLLLAAMTEESLNSYSYPAALAGLQFSVAASNRGLDLSVSGYTDKQSLLLGEVLDGLTADSYDEQRFADVKDELRRGWLNVAHQPPYRRLVSELNRSLLATNWSEQQLLAALGQIKLADVIHYRQQFLSRVNLEVFAYGNYTADQAEGYANMIADRLAVKPGARGELAVTELPEGKNWYRDVEVKHNDAAGLLYLQGRNDSYQERALMGVTAQLLKSPFYSSLRTEQQLGYIVYGAPKVTVKVPGLLLLVQSPSVSPSKIEVETVKFLQGFADRVAAEGVSAFERQRQALVSAVAKAPENLSEQAQIYWQQIELGNSAFDTREQLIKAIEGVQLDDWLAFYRQRFGGSIERSLWLQTKSQQAPLLQAKPIVDIDRFKSQQRQFHYR